MYDLVLKLVVPNGVSLIGYADHLAMMAIKKTKKELKWAMNEAAKTVTEWVADIGLTLAAHKTEVVVLVGPKKLPVLTLKVEELCITSKVAVEYLRVWIWPGFNRGIHVARTVPRVEEAVRNLAKLMPNVEGPQVTARRTLSLVCSTMMLYAAPFWADVLQQQKHQTAVNSLQRRMALQIISAYRTVSGPAAMVIAALLPLDLLAAERRRTSKDLKTTKNEHRLRTMREWQSR